MILDLRLPAGWTQAAIGQATSAPAQAAGPDSLQAATAGTLYTPPAEATAEDAGAAASPVGLLLSPLLPILRSPTLLLRAALDSEPDYELAHESPFISVRLGPWETTLLETEGRSRETGLVSARIYAVVDAGHAAFLLVFVDCDPTRLDLRREQLAEIIAGARLRRAPGLQAETDADLAAALPDLALPPEAASYSLDAGLKLDDEAAGADAASRAPAAAAAVDAADPGSPSASQPVVKAADDAAGDAAASADSSPEDDDLDEGALPTPPQRPAEDVYLGGVLFPHLID